MKNFIYSTLFTLIGFNGVHGQINRPIGVNLGGILDYSSEFVFVDAFQQCREWITHDLVPNAPWSSNVNVPLGTNGYPLEIPYNDGINPPQGIRTLLFFGDLAGIFPSGNYRLMVSGTGIIDFAGAVNGTFNCPIDTVINVNNTGGIILDIVESQASDPLRDFHFVMPGFHNTFQSNPYHPDLLDFVSDFQVLRFMDWQRTNNSLTEDWSDRNRPSNYTQTLDNGISPEILIDFSNRTQKNPWICMPHRASDDYFIEYATLLRNTLDTNLTIYIEYSNEVWNGQFDQNLYCEQMGASLGYSGDPWDQAWQYYAKRTADMFHIFDSVFVGTDRLKKVVASQAVNPWLSNQIVTYFNSPVYNPNQVKADMLAIAPYFGGVADALASAGLAASCTVDQILDSMEAQMPESLSWMTGTKTVADDHDLELVCYEGGQHLVAGYLYHNDVPFVDKLLAANRHPRMRDMYCDYFNFWYDSVTPSLFCHFASHYIANKFGSWGVKETFEDTLSPKYLGLKECVFPFNTSALDVEEISEKNASFRLYPNPTMTGLVTIEHDFIEPKLFIVNALGQVIDIKVDTMKSFFEVEFPNFTGLAFVILASEDQRIVQKLVVR